MPSPITHHRSTSEPQLPSSCKTHHKLPPSSRSTGSGTRSSKSSTSWFQDWTIINKLSNFFISSISRRKPFEEYSKDSDLTEENLQAHNRRHKPQQQQHQQRPHREAVEGFVVVDKNDNCSPYYKGLPDASRAISRERLNHGSNNQLSSPGRESHATVATSSTSSFSSFILKIQDSWGCCLSFKSTTNAPPPIPPPPPPFPPPSAPPIDLATSSSTLPMNEMDRKGSEDSNVTNEKKPLRESVPLSSDLLTPTTEKEGPGENILGGEVHKIDEAASKEISTTRGFTWANKYRPKALTNFICNRDKATQLQTLMRNLDCSHFIFEGPAGVGKRTMIAAMLQEAFGPDKMMTREEFKAFSLKGEAISSIKVRLQVSPRHVEVNLADMQGFQKHVIVDLIKETHNRISNKHWESKHESCHAIILYEADKLNTEALLYIKWLLDRYKGFTKFFFCCSDASKLKPIKALCTVVQLLPPSNEEIVQVLEFIAEQEGIELPRQLAERIANNCKNNLRQAIRSFEASWQRCYPFVEDQEILSGWEDDIANIAKNMIEEQSPKQLYVIRGKLQNLIEHDVSPDYTFDSLLQELKKHLDETFHLQIDNMHGRYKKNIRHTDGLWLDSENHHSRQEENQPTRKKSDNFLRIEEFIAEFMSFYKTSVADNKERAQ